MSERMDGWRECADPVELAAAVADGVEVQRNEPGWSSGAWCKSRASSEASFAAAMREGNRYRVPASWSWSPEPPGPVGDLRERIARAIYADDVENERTDFREGVAPCYYDNADAVLAVLPAPPTDEGAGPSGPPWYLAQDVWMALGGDSDAFSAWAHCEDDRRTWGDAWAQIIAAVGGSRMEGDTNPPPGTILDLPSYQWVRESPTPSPVPPWPGAVLSGLCDEDGVPTWLAQAGQVRGEQVRRRSDFMWVNNDQMVAHLDTVWVEVRAPRAVPEPETERVPWYRAMGRELVDGLLCVENAMIREVGREGDRVYVCGYEDPDNPDEDDRGDWQRNYWYGRDGFDGTVEVLKDGDR